MLYILMGAGKTSFPGILRKQHVRKLIDFRVNHDPFRDFNNIAVSDPFYTIGYGTNYITNRTQSQAFTSVHEFSNVCRNGVAPSGWVFYTSSANSACTSSSYRFTTGRITTTTGTRPAKTNFSGRSINAAGEIEITWTGADGAQSYNAFIRIPTNRYEGKSQNASLIYV